MEGKKKHIPGQETWPDEEHTTWPPRARVTGAWRQYLLRKSSSITHWVHHFGMGGKVRGAPSSLEVFPFWQLFFFLENVSLVLSFSTVTIANGFLSSDRSNRTLKKLKLWLQGKNKHMARNYLTDSEDHYWFNNLIDDRKKSCKRTRLQICPLLLGKITEKT